MLILSNSTLRADHPLIHILNPFPLFVGLKINEEPISGVFYEATRKWHGKMFCSNSGCIILILCLTTTKPKSWSMSPWCIILILCLTQDVLFLYYAKCSRLGIFAVSLGLILKKVCLREKNSPVSTFSNNLSTFSKRCID